MMLFLACFIPGFAILYLFTRHRVGWASTVIGIVLGIIAAYAAVYVLGNYIQADLIAEMKYVMGEDLAIQTTNTLYGRALLSASAAVIGCGIAMQIRKTKAMHASEN
jgi:hypothetical protein